MRRLSTYLSTLGLAYVIEVRIITTFHYADIIFLLTPFIYVFRARRF